MQNFSPVKTAQYLLKEKLQDADVIIDATCGAGNDCLFLTMHAHAGAQIVAFDIQHQALERTKELLIEYNLLDRVQLHNDSYVNFAHYVQKKIDLVIFNLGYLPGADKQITTLVNDLRMALPEMLHRLNRQGVVCIVSYVGHEAGKCEHEWLESYLPSLVNSEFNVGKYILFNHNKQAPIVYIIEKLKGENCL